MMREMTAQQFNEWLAYYQIEPFGVLTDDLQWAHWKSMYVNAHSKKGRRIKLEKFQLFAEKQKDASEIFDAEDEEEL